MSKKIMVVDDEPDILATVGQMLEMKGFEVIKAIDGKECIKKLNESATNPDLILLDIMMPDVSGWDVAAKIKENPNWKSKYWLSIYWSGDQYVTGVGEWYNILDLLNKKNPTKKDIIDYLLKNYEGLKMEDIEILKCPRIYYIGTMTVAGYSYVYDFETRRAMIFNWDKQIFLGSIEEVRMFIKQAKGI